MTNPKNMADSLRQLTLSQSEVDMIIADAERILTETLAAHELFVSNDRQLPQDRWKFVKTKEHVHVYRSRSSKKKPSTPDASPSRSSNKCTSNSDDDSYRQRSETMNDTLLTAYDFTSSGTSSLGDDYTENSTSTRAPLSSTVSSSTNSSNSSGSSERVNSSHSAADIESAKVTACEQVSVEINRSRPADRPLVIATGIIGGTVDDVAFGMLAHTERLWRHRDAHMADQYAAAKILATITRPTPQSPFNSLTVKWSAKSVGALARMRDCVYIEANGVATDARGERVAYSLVHSLDSLPRIPGFKHLDVVRVNQSTCYLSRQHDQSSVEVFCRGFVDPGGKIVSINVFVDMVLSIVHVVDCAYVKKLVWLAHSKQEKLATVSRRGSPSPHCEHCATSFSSFSNLFQTSASCQACKREICSKCCVPKKVAVDGKHGAAKMKDIVFCLRCIVQATRAPTHDVALAMLGLAAER